MKTVGFPYLISIKKKIQAAIAASHSSFNHNSHYQRLQSDNR